MIISLKSDMKKVRINLKWLIILICFSVAPVLNSQTPFSRGVNLTEWLQVSNAGQIQFTRFTKQDIRNIKSLGCDVIRLPVNLHDMTSGSPSYTISPLLFNFLDSAVTWCEELKICLIIDNHSSDPSGNTTPGIGEILNKVWTQMARHYKNSSEYILYEILNEPHGMTTSDWGIIQGQVINTIRTYDTKHTIVVGGSGYNTYTEMKNLPEYTDANLLYTFHFYDPFLFTHQGATWVSPSMESLSGVPFPYCGACMPSLPVSLKGSWIESAYNSYPSQGNAEYIKTLIDNAISFRDSRHVNIYCGELGAYIPNSDPVHRVNWYSVVRHYLEDNNIPWTSWDYKGGFGLFNKNSNQQFENDLNVPLLEALGLNVPAQTPFSLKADSSGFNIYTDYIGEKIYDESYTSGNIDFYSSDMPDNDNYCLSWNGFSQYNAIGFDFQPDKDLSRLATGGYAIDFMVRGNTPGIKFDIRFIDTKTGDAGDHPWRMGTTIDENMIAGDRKWHHVHIPLSVFNERGSWDNGTWYSAAGKFDWKAVDKMEISTEYAVTSGKQVWFDNIVISDQDTASVREPETLGIEETPGNASLQMRIAPNPVSNYVLITYYLEKECRIRINIFSLTGIWIRCLADEVQVPGKKSVVWDGTGENGIPLRKGLYLLQITAPGISCTEKIIKN
jgi:endoglucanase